MGGRVEKVSIKYTKKIYLLTQTVFVILLSLAIVLPMFYLVWGTYLWIALGWTVYFFACSFYVVGMTATGSRRLDMLFLLGILASILVLLYMASLGASILVWNYFFLVVAGDFVWVLCPLKKGLKG